MDVEIAPMITSHFDPAKMVDTKAIRGQVKELMHTKMEMLTPEMVKAVSPGKYSPHTFQSITCCLFTSSKLFNMYCWTSCEKAPMNL